MQQGRIEKAKAELLDEKITVKMAKEILEHEKRINETRPRALIGEKNEENLNPVVGSVTVAATIVALAALGVAAGVNRVDVLIPAIAVAGFASITAIVSVTHAQANNVKIRERNEKAKAHNEELNNNQSDLWEFNNRTKDTNKENKKERERLKSETPLSRYCEKIGRLNKKKRHELAEKIIEKTGGSKFYVSNKFSRKLVKTAEYRAVRRSISRAAKRAKA